MDAERLADLESRLSRLEKRLERLESVMVPHADTAPPAPAAAPPDEPAALDSLPVPPPPRPRGILEEYRAAFHASPADSHCPGESTVGKPASPPHPSDLEHRIGSIWLPRLGAVLVAISALFLLKWTYDRLGPAARLGLGYLLGAALTGAGVWAESRTFRPLAGSLLGAGSVVFYLCTFAGYAHLHLLGKLPSLGLMALITGVSLAFAVPFRQISPAIIGLVGGFLAPACLGSAGDDQRYLGSLLGYLAVLDLSLLWLVLRQRWPHLIALGFIATYAYLLYYSSVLLSMEPMIPLAISAFFFTVFALATIREPHLNPDGDVEDSSLSIMITLGNGVFLVAWVLTVFYRHAYLRAWPGLGVLAAAILHFALAYIVSRFTTQNHPLVPVYLGLGLAMVTLAVPLQLKDNALALTWLAEALLLTGLGMRTRRKELGWAGFLVYALALIVALGLALPPLFRRFEHPVWLPPQLLSLAGVALISPVLAVFYREAAYDRRKTPPPS